MSAITSTISAGGQNGGSLDFQTNAWGEGNYLPQTRMTILPQGQVGIGTALPNTKLDWAYSNPYTPLKTQFSKPKNNNAYYRTKTNGYSRHKYVIT